VTDDNAITDNEHHHPSPPTPAVGAELQPSPASASENEAEIVLSSGLTIPQQSPSDSTPPITPSVPTTGDVVTSTGHPDDPTTLPTSPKVKVFTFDGTSNFVTPSAMDYLETIPGGQGWINMVKAYLRLERFPLHSCGCHFFVSKP